MGILNRILGAAEAMSSASIRVAISRDEALLDKQHASLSGALANVATMDDAEHVKAEVSIAATKRAITRLEAGLAQMRAELPNIEAAEAAALKAKADEDLRQRVEASRKANTKEAAKLLNEYEKLAGPMANILARLAEIRTETDAINAELRLNPVAETVVSYNEVHRMQPARPASVRREARPCHVYRYPASPRDSENLKYLQIPASEEVREATIGPDGNPRPGGAVHYDQFGRTIIIQPRLENREVVVERKMARRASYEPSLEEVRLPPAFAGGVRHWPRT